MKQVILSIFLLLNVSVYAEESEWWEYYDRTKTIHLQFVDEVRKGYTVSVTWTPDGGLAPMLTGPALIHFNSNKKYGAESFSIGAEYFHIPSDTLSEAGLELFKDDGYNLSVDLSKTYKIKYSPYKKISLWNNIHHFEESGAREQTPFFFEDIDFDGIDELIVTSFNSGQRGDNEYSVYKLHTRWSNVVYKEMNFKPFSFIDQHTTFDKQNKDIKKYYSGGSCANSEDIYKLIDGRFKYIEHKKWRPSNSMIVGSICTESTFDIVDGRRVVKSESDDYYDNNKRKWVKVCDENAATQSKSYLEFVMRNKACLAGGLQK